MLKKQFLVSIVAILMAVFAVSLVAAGTLDVTIDEVEVDEVSGSGLGAFSGDEIDIQVEFTANDDIEDVRVEVWIDGFRDENRDTTGRFDVINDRTYVRSFTLTLPDEREIDDLDEEITVNVRVFDKNDEVEEKFEMSVQRESYNYNLLSVEAPKKAEAGDIVGIDVVLKNIGSKELEDSFVTVTITDLDIRKKVYFGDIFPEDNFDDDEDNEDARERRIYIVIPNDAVSGEYDLEVRATNFDASSKVTRTIAIEGVDAEKPIDTADNGEDNDSGVSNSIVVLTVVLVIVFLVLLIVLIVLLTKKPDEKEEDFGETSYY